MLFDKIYKKQVFRHKRTYNPKGDCIVDITTVTTIFGHVFKKFNTVVMPYGHVCNNCTWNGAFSKYSNDPEKPCINCPLH